MSEWIGDVSMPESIHADLSRVEDRVEIRLIDTGLADGRHELSGWFDRAEFLAAVEAELGVIVIDRADLPKLVWDENGKLDTGCEWAGSFDLRYWRVTALEALAALHYHEWRTSPDQLALTEALDTANIKAHPSEIKRLLELGVRVSSDE